MHHLVGVEVIGHVADVFGRKLVGERGDFGLGGLACRDFIDEGIAVIAIDVIGVIFVGVTVDADEKGAVFAGINGFVEAQNDADGAADDVVFGVLLLDLRHLIVDEGHEEPDVVDFAVPGLVAVIDGQAEVERPLVGIGLVEHGVIDAVGAGEPRFLLLDPIEALAVFGADAKILEVDEVIVFLPGVDVLGDVIHRLAIDAVATALAGLDFVIKRATGGFADAVFVVFGHELLVARAHVDVGRGMEFVVVDVL